MFLVCIICLVVKLKPDMNPNFSRWSFPTKGTKATLCCSCTSCSPHMEYSRSLQLGCSLAVHNKLLNEMKKSSVATRGQTCVCVPVFVHRSAENVDVSFKGNGLRKGDGDPFLLMLRHDLAQVSPLAWGKGHFEEWKSNTGIWAGPLSHWGY